MELNSILYVIYTHVSYLLYFRGMWLTGIVGSLTYFLLAVSLFMSDYHKKFVSTTTKLKEADNLTVVLLNVIIHQKLSFNIIKKNFFNKVNLKDIILF